jgi:hypothetical protein
MPTPVTLKLADLQQQIDVIWFQGPSSIVQLHPTVRLLLGPWVG